jgi:colanic acid/amylovoran biosynthesis glycosyltransferase
VLKGPNLHVTHLWCDYYINADGNPHEYLKRTGNRSTIICSKFLTDTLQFSPDIHAFSIKKINGPNGTRQSLLSRIWNKLYRPLFWMNYRRWVHRLVKADRPDIFHLHFGYTAVRLLPMLKAEKIPFIITFYGVDCSSMLAQPYWVKQYQEVLKHASFIIVLSETVRERFRAIGCPDNKIVVWQIPIRLNNYQYYHTPRVAHIRFITAARFVEKKGFPFLIAAFKKVLAEIPGSTLTIIGYGAGKDKILAEIERQELNESITLIDTNLRTDFPEFYAAQLKEHDIFALPSTTSKNGDDEGGPALTLVAAQASGKPVVCTPFVGSEISVTDGKTGLICLQDDAGSLAEKMICLANDPALAQMLGQSASTLVHSLFSEENQMDKLLEIYHKAINGGNYTTS